MNKSTATITGKKLAQYVFGLLVGGVIFYFLGRIVADNWEGVRNNLKDIDYLWVAVSLICYLTFYTVNSTGWYQSTKAIAGEDARITPKDFPNFWYAFNISLFGRYTPSKVFMYIFRAAALKDFDKKIVTLSLYFDTITFSIASVIAAIPFVFVRSSQYTSYSVILLAVALAAAFVPKLSQVFFKKFHIPKVKIERLVFSIVIYLISFLFMALAMAATIISFYTLPIDLDIFILIYSAIGVSFVFSNVAFFVPASIGVRESIYAFAFSSVMPLEIAITMGIIFRLVSIVAELILLPTSFYLREKFAKVEAV